MTNPYSVLGVSPDASDEEIKAAYKNLARQYHPDSYADNPLKDLAEEKMKEINQAYDAIMKMRSGGQASGSGDFANIRQLIESGQLDAALRELDGVPLGNRTAEWNFLMGRIFSAQGRFFDARNFYARACQMEPSNFEYRSAFDQMSRQGAQYGGHSPYAGQGSQCSGCDICASLICLDACCIPGGCC